VEELRAQLEALAADLPPSSEIRLHPDDIAALIEAQLAIRFGGNVWSYGLRLVADDTQEVGTIGT
jgi:hypothetical protein